MNLLHTPHNPRKLQGEFPTGFVPEFANPAFFRFFGNRIQPLCHISGGDGGIISIGHQFDIQRTGNRQLLNDAAIITRVKTVQQSTHLQCPIHRVTQIRTSHHFTGTQRQRRFLKATFDEIIFPFGLVLQILFGLSPLYQIKRRLGDIEITLLNQLRHLAEKERQQQCTDVRTINIGIRHDDDFMVAGLFDVEFVFANTRAQSGNQCSDLLGRQHFIKPRPFNI